jgi:hypothetical protein
MMLTPRRRRESLTCQEGCMQDYGLREALTGDHHFEQAGFNALMK